MVGADSVSAKTSAPAIGLTEILLTRTGILPDGRIFAALRLRALNRKDRKEGNLEPRWRTGVPPVVHRPVIDGRDARPPLSLNSASSKVLAGFSQLEKLPLLLPARPLSEEIPERRRSQE